MSELHSKLLIDVAHIGARFGRAALASSLSAEDMVITDAIVTSGAPIDVFVIDTGRLHAETLELLERAESHFDFQIERMHPDPVAVDGYVRQHGINAFYDSVALRQACCGLRKVEPLQRALVGRDAWLTGQRRAHDPQRAALLLEERDERDGRVLAKFNPLALWSDEDLWSYVRTRHVPVNPLHARGYPSIGCEPCTRAVKPGEPIRAGRWWWEQSASRECGLHLHTVSIEKALQ